MDTQISFELKHPPTNTVLDEISLMDASTCLLFGSPWFADFRAKYGHVVLVFQELEQELKHAVDYMKKAYEKQGINEVFEAEPDTATFHELIRMFASQLNQSHGSRDLVSRLHQARKYRNRLAHDFTSSESLENHLSAGGRARTIDQLDLRINHVVLLVMVVYRIGRAYAAEVCVTAEYLSESVKMKFDALGLDDDQIFTYVTGDVREARDGTEPSFDLNDL